jgi:histidyl-tRNA synthetase
VGSSSLLNEVELASLYSQAFQQLRIPVEIRINNRKILSALANLCGGPAHLTDITVAIDKIDKIGVEKVEQELLQKGLTDEQVKLIRRYLTITGTSEEKIQQAEALLGSDPEGRKGIDELTYVIQYFNEGSSNKELVIDFTLGPRLEIIIPGQF